jgi:hypothetical protein
MGQKRTVIAFSIIPTTNNLPGCTIRIASQLTSLDVVRSTYRMQLLLAEAFKNLSTREWPVLQAADRKNLTSCTTTILGLTYYSLALASF